MLFMVNCCADCATGTSTVDAVDVSANWNKIERTFWECAGPMDNLKLFYYVV